MPDTPAARDDADVAKVRRAPKYSVFAALGAAVGLVAALVLSTVFDGTSEASVLTQVEYSPSQTFGFIMLWCVPAGVLLGMLVALLLDWTIGRRTRDVRVAHESVDEG
ncbi:potassium transporter Trk [Microbacterium betulae]|uniref:Potassium transporter Trk n=1 Tax=Microbacterium betulae TaxID=2981139 RepID=A0AA97I4K3_9MICO|nr:potassium transporter Trk [Microbacterium sp. AB]WOF22696.1 potassium transporter Trk [Microbacterium sp. AB]